MTDETYNQIVNSRPITHLIINLTDRCNLGCKYCFTTPHCRDITMPIMKECIKFLMKQIDKFPEYEERPSIAFFGGEPMLKYDSIIQPTITWLERSGIKDQYKIKLNMTTNGTLLTEERCEWLRNHDLWPLLSIDGAQFTQDDQRPLKNGGSSFDLVYKNIPSILKYWPGTTFRSAVEPRNVDKIFENYLFARETGFQNYFIIPNTYTEWPIDKIEILLYQISAINEAMLMDIESGAAPCICNELLKHYKEILIPSTRPALINDVNYFHCGIGVTSCGIAVDGTINGCQEHNTYIGDDIFKIGDVYNGIDKEKHKILLDEYGFNGHPVCKEKPEFCNYCQFYEQCKYSYCPSQNLANGHATENSLVMCMLKNFYAKLAYETMKSINDKNDEVMIGRIVNLIKERE